MSLICREFGFVFIHVSKTAGSSIKTVLGEAGAVGIGEEPDLAARILEQRRKRGGPKHLNHVRPVELRRAMGERAFDALEIVSVCRNPWDRLRSLHDYHHSRPLKRLKPRFRQLMTLSFNDFIFDVCESGFTSVSRSLSSPKGEFLADTILRFEQIDKDFGEFTERVFGRALELPVKNRSPRTAGQTYDERAIAAVRTHFADDIERFGYPDSPPD